MVFPSFRQKTQANGDVGIYIPSLSIPSHGGRISTWSPKAFSRLIFLGLSFIEEPLKNFQARQEFETTTGTKI
jgi:hypothetical protein